MSKSPSTSDHVGTLWWKIAYNLWETSGSTDDPPSRQDGLGVLIRKAAKYSYIKAISF